MAGRHEAGSEAGEVFRRFSWNLAGALAGNQPDAKAGGSGAGRGPRPAKPGGKTGGKADRKTGGRSGSGR